MSRRDRIARASLAPAVGVALVAGTLTAGGVLVGAGPAAAAGSRVAIGDSVMVGAKSQLQSRGFRVDATVSRQFYSADDVLRSYAGRYAGPFGRPMRLRFDDGELYSPAPYGRRRMLPLGETTFLDEETGATLEVERHDDGGPVRRIAVLVEGSELMAFEPIEESGDDE